MLLLIPSSPAPPEPQPVLTGEEKSPFLVVLGITQDGGYPQAGSKGGPGWKDSARQRHVVSLAIVDPATSQRWMIEATPDFKLQLHSLDEIAPVPGTPGLQGIFLTHAHIGHYLGLAHLGHEVVGARGVPVYAMPRMREFLRSNGPWDQLVRYGNVELRKLSDGVAIRLNRRLSLTPFLVPHRQEYSEVIGYRIQGPRKSALFIPDIDSWAEWDAWGTRIEEMVASVDAAYLDGSFFADGEIPGRDMSGFPHPFITHSMRRFGPLSAEERQKIRFIHLNHTNPVLDPNSPQHQKVLQAGFRVAEELERFELQ